MAEAHNHETILDILHWGNEPTNAICPPVPKDQSFAAFVKKYCVGNFGCAFCLDQCYVRFNVPGVLPKAKVTMLKVPESLTPKPGEPVCVWRFAFEE